MQKNNTEAEFLGIFDKSHLCKSFSKYELANLLQLLSKEEKLRREQREMERKFFRDLTELRKAKGITQKEISDKTGLSQSIVSRMENEKRARSFSNIEKYLSALGLKVRDLYA